jgi:hypothetical protein
MSYSAQTHLVYIPVIDVPAIWVDMAHNGGSVKFLDGFFTANAVTPDDTYDAGVWWVGEDYLETDRVLISRKPRVNFVSLYRLY